MTDEDLQLLFSKFGKVTSCRIVRDSNRISLAYAFVQYDSAASTANSILELNGHQIGTKRIKVSYSRQSSPNIKHANLYVAQLPRTYTATEFEALFSEYGQIITSNILFDESGSSKGVGFIRFDKDYQADQARVALDKHIPDGHSEPLLCSMHITRHKWMRQVLGG